MRCINDDGKVFNTEYEQRVEKQKVEKRKVRKRAKGRLDTINKKYEELQKILFEYEKDYGVNQMPYVVPFYEILDMLCR